MHSDPLSEEVRIRQKKSSGSRKKQQQKKSVGFLSKICLQLAHKVKNLSKIMPYEAKSAMCKAQCYKNVIPNEIHTINKK